MQRAARETVRCTVSNCKHWGKDNYCSADQILITAPASPLLKAEKHGVGAEKLHETPIKKTEDSLCYTFESKQ
ncbi:MAG: DUF1540 domain-containing protein [Chloroflexi bacterium]|nr:DUF1540 domain-containing protein [Chloroflexota bacterium]MDA8188433.1 DUF1540 domain-containing protein [Dehalococcoidales bacterium]